MIEKRESLLREDRKLVERIDQFGKGLTSSESSFMESCMKRLAAGQPLTEPMRKWAADIDEKRVGA